MNVGRAWKWYAVACLVFVAAMLLLDHLLNALGL